MGTGSPADADGSDDLPSDLDRQTTAEYKDILVHVAKRLQRRNFHDEFSQFRGRTAQACCCVGFFSAALNRMRPRTIRSSHGAKDAGTIHNRHADSIAILLAHIER